MPDDHTDNPDPSFKLPDDELLDTVWGGHSNDPDVCHLVDSYRELRKRAGAGSVRYNKIADKYEAELGRTDQLRQAIEAERLLHGQATEARALIEAERDRWVDMTDRLTNIIMTLSTRPAETVASWETETALDTTPNPAVSVSSDGVWVLYEGRPYVRLDELERAEAERNREHARAEAGWAEAQALGEMLSTMRAERDALHNRAVELGNKNAYYSGIKVHLEQAEAHIRDLQATIDSQAADCRKLDALEAAGVDNWEGYDTAMDDWRADEDRRAAGNEEAGS